MRSLLPLRPAALVALSALSLGACSPALNWREVQPDGAALRLMFPCKPEREDRAQESAPGHALALHSFSCRAQDLQFSLTWTDLGDASVISPALARMREGPSRQLTQQATVPLALRGMSPDPQAQQQVFAAPPGQPAQELRQAVFAKDTRVYQLLVQGRRVPPEVWETFLGGVALPP